MDDALQARRALELGLRQRSRQGRIPARLPAAVQPRRRSASPAWRRCCAGPSGAGHHRPARIHSRRRGDRPDRPDRRMGAERSLPRRRRLARRRRRRRQPFAGPVPQSQPGAARQGGAGELRAAAARLELEMTESLLLADNDATLTTSTSCARSASASRWTISAPAIPRSATCARSPSTRSRSTSRSCTTSPAPTDIRAIVNAVIGLGRASACRPPPRASRPRTSWNWCAPRLQRGAGLPLLAATAATAVDQLFAGSTGMDEWTRAVRQAT